MLQRACELGSHYAMLEKEVMSLRLELDAEKLKSACLQKEKAALGGKSFPPSGSCILFFPFDSSHSAPTDVRSENTQLVMRLRTSISLETMKHALENKDKDQALA